jgi:hypothetical protein
MCGTMPLFQISATVLKWAGDNCLLNLFLLVWLESNFKTHV